METGLENPFLYRLSQTVLAPGMEEAVLKEIGDFFNPEMSRLRHLDVGCGPGSFLWRASLKPCGLDVVHAHNVQFRQRGGRFITAAAEELPFLDSSFDHIWSFGLFHHLSDDRVVRVIREMTRVVRGGGWIVIFDGVVPHSFLHHPFSWVLRRLDLGRHMRTQKDFESLFTDRDRWRINRFQYCLWGHEGVLCIYQKQDEQ